MFDITGLTSSINANVIACNYFKINAKALIQLPTEVSYLLEFVVPTRMNKITLSI